MVFVLSSDGACKTLNTRHLRMIFFSFCYLLTLSENTKTTNTNFFFPLLAGFFQLFALILLNYFPFLPPFLFQDHADNVARRPSLSRISRTFFPSAIKISSLSHVRALFLFQASVLFVVLSPPPLMDRSSLAGAATLEYFPPRSFLPQTFFGAFLFRSEFPPLSRDHQGFPLFGEGPIFFKWKEEAVADSGDSQRRLFPLFEISPFRLLFLFFFCVSGFLFFFFVFPFF